MLLVRWGVSTASITGGVRYSHRDSHPGLDLCPAGRLYAPAAPPAALRVLAVRDKVHGGGFERGRDAGSRDEAE
ncbi:MAG TPA: hypothetical protein VFO59_04665, partial [Dehalococcoidia bacterium]|nr:hypothetical protein [Dehalococcoidia bacterium]